MLIVYLIILPLLSTISSGLLGRYIGIKGTNIITLIAILGSTLASSMIYYEVVYCESPIYLKLYEWLNSDLINSEFSLTIDSVSSSMLIAVNIVSLIVHIYSIDYMKGDPHYIRYISYLTIFTLFMILLVTSSNIALIFIIWEGIGVSSFLLISFWYSRLSAVKAGLQAMITNRIGDIALTIAIILICNNYSSLDYEIIGSQAIFFNPYIFIIGLLLLVAAIAKSAQFGLHTWLPTSIEGPTPVSALIHAATLVTAGVYLLIRNCVLLEQVPDVLTLITYVGIVTVVFAGTVGSVQNDLKRIIAFSTCSQIAYIFISLGLSQYNAALFHLVSHAFFKSLLFLSAGGVLHAISDIQDIRKYGGLMRYLPLTYVSILIASLSLIALPWISGFYSKDFILELAYGHYHINGQLVFYIGSLGALFTGYYSMRLLRIVFASTPNNKWSSYYTHDTSSILVVVPYVVLGILSIIFGYMTHEIYIGLGSDMNYHNGNLNNISSIEAHYNIPILMKNFPLLITVLGSVISLVNIKSKFLNGKWWLDVVYIYVVLGGLTVSIWVSKLIDRGSIELIFAHGLSKTLISLSTNYKLYNMYISTNALLMVVIVYIFIFIKISYMVYPLLIIAYIIVTSLAELVDVVHSRWTDIYRTGSSPVTCIIDLGYITSKEIWYDGYTQQMLKILVLFILFLHYLQE